MGAQDLFELGVGAHVKESKRFALGKPTDQQGIIRDEHLSPIPCWATSRSTGHILHPKDTACEEVPSPCVWSCLRWGSTAHESHPAATAREPILRTDSHIGIHRNDFPKHERPWEPADQCGWCSDAECQVHESNEARRESIEAAAQGGGEQYQNCSTPTKSWG